MLKTGEKEKWRHKGTNKQQQPDSSTHDTTTHCPFGVLSSNLLGLTVPEKSVTKNSNVWMVNWTWRFHDMSIENLIRPQGQVTPKWLIRSGRNSNWSVLVTRKFDEDRIKNEWASLEIPFSHYKSMGNFSDAQGQLTPVVRSGRNSNSSEILCMSSLPASIKRIGSKTTEKRWINRFPHYKSMGAFCFHGNQSFDPICPKTLCNLSPTLMMLHIKFDQHSEIFMFHLNYDRMTEPQNSGRIRQIQYSPHFFKAGLQ